MNTVLSQVTILFKNRRKSLLYISLAIFTVAVEEIFEQIVFNCPCTDHMAYGMAFILAPALLLFILGIVLDKDALVVLLPCTKSYNGEDGGTRTRTVRIFDSMIRVFEFAARACAAPMVWVILSLLRKQYYVCAFFGPPVETTGAESRLSVVDHYGNTTDECGNTERGQRLLEQIAYQTYSQVLGCWLMAAAIAVFLLLVVLRRFSRKRRQFHTLGNHIYRHIEARAAILEFHKEAKRLAEQNGKQMVHECLSIQSSDNYMQDINNARVKIVARYNQYTIIPDSPTTPVVPPEDSADGAGVSEEPQEASPSTSTPASPDRENMYFESRNLTRVIYLRETTT